MEKAPEFLQSSEPVESQFDIGGNFSLHCDVEGQPEPQMNWYRNNELLTNENPISSDNFTDISNRTFWSSNKRHLRIINATMENFGEYTCQAYNKLGEINRDFHIVVTPYWGEWSEWGECTKTCGHGVKKRHRICNRIQSHQSQINCTGQDEEFEECIRRACELDWSPCSKTCGYGQTYRVIGNTVEIASCFRQPCAKNSFDKQKFLPLHTWESSRKSHSRNQRRKPSVQTKLVRNKIYNQKVQH